MEGHRKGGLFIWMKEDCIYDTNITKEFYHY